MLHNLVKRRAIVAPAFASSWRFLEIAVILAVVAVGATFYTHTTPPRPYLTFNGVKPGDRVSHIEARLGKPDFRNPSAHFQQWEHPLTLIKYDDQGLITEVAGSGRGVLRRGDRVLLTCGDREDEVAIALGKEPQPATPQESRREDFYSYPGHPATDREHEEPDLKVHCGSHSEGPSWVTHIQLNVHDAGNAIPNP